MISHIQAQGYSPGATADATLLRMIGEHDPLVAPAPPSWFFGLLAMLALAWFVGVAADIVLTDGPHRLALRIYSAVLICWAMALTLGTVLSIDVAPVALWLVYLPLLVALAVALAWLVIGALALRRSQQHAEAEKLAEKLAAENAMSTSTGPIEPASGHQPTQSLGGPEGQSGYPGPRQY